MNDHIMPTYARLPVTFERGEGIWLWDSQGNCFLDALSGIAVCGLGHAHPAIREAIWEQAGKLLHTSNLYGVERQEQLAEKLCEASGMDNVFFCNSGTEANEAAIKIARLYGHDRGIRVPRILVMENSFHGRTLGALSATGNLSAQQGFGPMLDGFIRVPFNDLEAIHAAADEHNDIVAILTEPIQGEGGIRMPSIDYLANLRAICDQNNWLLMVDEIQTGIGRSGQFLAFQHAAIRPDVCTLAKALGNGFPIGACLAAGNAASVLSTGKHGSTFGGNPLACQAALTVLEILQKERLVPRAAALGTRMISAFSENLSSNPNVSDVRGQGLMIGIELSEPCSQLVSDALNEKLLVSVQAGHVVRLLPPLITDDSQADNIVETVCKIINRFTGNPPEIPQN